MYSITLLERHKFEYGLVEKALAAPKAKDRAVNLKFMTGIGLLNGLNGDAIKTASENPDEQLPIFLGAALRDRLITVQEAKGVLKFLTYGELKVPYYDGPVNDVADLAFRIAVMKFQRAENLEIDGYVGPKTLLALWEACPGCPGLLQALQDTSNGSGQ
jgi:hypothetical protein